MATQFAVDLVFKTQGDQKIKNLSKQLEGLSRKAKNAQGGLDGASNGIRRTGRAAASATANVQRFGIAFRSVLGPLVAVTGAITFFSRSLKTLGERQADVAALQNGLKGLTTNGTAALESLLASADKLGKQTLFNDEDFRKSFKLLTSFRTIGVSTYEQVATVAADMAQVLGQDVNSVMLQVAKALEAPEVGLTALQRSGTRFTEQQKEQVKQMVAAGKTAEAQAFILSELERQYGGAAKAAGSAGFAGAMDSLGESFRDFQETIGRVIEPLATGFIKALTASIEWMNAGYQAVLKLIGAFSPLGELLDSLGINWENFGKAADLAGKVVSIVANDVAYIINQMAQVVADVLGGLFKGIGQFFSGIVDSSAQGMKGVVDNVVKGIRAIRNAIASLINSTPPAMLSKLLGFDVGKTLTAPIGGVASGIEGAFNYGSSVLQRAQSLDFGKGGGYQDILGSTTPDPTQQGGGRGTGSTAREKELKKEKDAIDLLKQSFNGLTATLEDFSGWRWEEILGGPEEIAEIDQNLQGLADGIGNSFGSLFSDLVKGNKTAAEAFKDFFNSILDSLISVAAKMIAQYIAIGIAKSFAGIGGGSGGFGVDSTGLAGPSSPFGSFPGLGIGGSFAEGGQPPVRKLSLVGERGPELFVPGTRGTIIPNDQLGGGGGVNSVVNVTINSDGSSNTDASQGEQLGRQINSAVKAIIMHERRPGGLLAR